MCIIIGLETSAYKGLAFTFWLCGMTISYDKYDVQLDLVNLYFTNWFASTSQSEYLVTFIENKWFTVKLLSC